MLQTMREKLRCREINDDDIGQVAELLARSFADRQNQLLRLGRLAQRSPPSGLPRFGYLLEQAGRPVGAILTICSSICVAGVSSVRCNLTSWHVEPELRGYGALLTSQALKQKDLVYLNVTARPSTWAMVEAQGFSRYSGGTFVALPSLSRRTQETKVRVDSYRSVCQGLDVGEAALLHDHVGFGCMAIVCRSAEGVHPFVLARRDLKGRIPCVQLVYCRSIDEFVRCARPIGRYLAARGILLVALDAHGPVPGLVGKYYPGRMPKFIRGGPPVRLGDLAYTNLAVFCGL
jgi:hypothetical protein